MFWDFGDEVKDFKVTLKVIFFDRIEVTFFEEF